MTEPLKILFAGTPDFAACHLQALIASEHQVIGVLTQPDRPAGRGNKLTPSPVKQLALTHGIPVYQPATLRKAENQQLIAELRPDILIVVAYGLILPEAVLSIPRYGCFNVHGSLLPRWRGAAPIQRAVWAGDTETGVTIMQMDAGLDTGDMLCKLSCPIRPDDTSASLYARLAELGPRALLQTLSLLVSQQLHPEKQDDSQATYAHKLTKEEARLNWQESAVKLERCIRAFNPWPVSFFMVDDQPVKVWQAEVLPHVADAQPGTIVTASREGIAVATAEGVLNILQLQPAGKKVMAAQDILNSRREWFKPGTVLA